MGGNFINTTYNNTIDSLLAGSIKKLDNPYYKFTDKKPTPVVYFNLNTKMSTLDESSRQVESPLGKGSPFKFNKINDALLYGDIPKALLSVEVGEFGTEAASIEGELYVLPDTFIPYQDDYFFIKYLDKDLLFRVIGVTPDTIDGGANFYKINVKLDQYDRSIEDQVVETYNMIANNVGSNFSSIIRNSDYDIIVGLESVLLSLKEYYCALFYNDKVQTFTYKYDNTNFYDSYLIEFLIRNKILRGTKNYMYIAHQLYTGRTFALDYDRTIFKQLEIRNKDLNLNTAYGTLIEDPRSLMSIRYEDYFSISYNLNCNAILSPVPTIDSDLITAIKEYNRYSDYSDTMHYNIIIDFFNNKFSLNSNVLKIIENINYKSDIILFYTIPMIIYILENSIKELLIKKDGDNKWNGSVD